MKYHDLLEVVGSEPLFETGLLLAGEVDPADVRRQLSRWTASGQLVKLRRGLYALAPPFSKNTPHPFLIANRLVPASYVSLQSALAHYDLIPEYVPVVTSVTTSRPRRWDTDLGAFDFRGVKREFFHGFQPIKLTDTQSALVASPEKALLDLVYLEAASDNRAFLEGLRLQNLEQLDPTRLSILADDSKKAKLRRAVDIINELAAEEAGAYVSL
jgi:predicted transcriptional regulator of viral defense system